MPDSYGELRQKPTIAPDVAVTFHEATGVRTVAEAQGFAIPDVYPNLKIDLAALFKRI
jgi:hypothetical protein